MNDHTPSYDGYRYPAEVISHAVWLDHRFCLSFRDVEELLAERGIMVTYETVRQWCRKFAPEYVRRLKRNGSCRCMGSPRISSVSDAICCEQPTTEY